VLDQLPGPARDRLEESLEVARSVIRDDQAANADRANAMRVVASGASGAADPAVFEECLAAWQPLEVQAAAVAALARLPDESAAVMLLDRLDSFSPTVRAAVLEAIFARSAWTSLLLRRAAAGELSIRQLSAARRQALLEHDDEAIREQAAALLSPTVGSRAELVAARQHVLAMPGDRERGREVFLKRCSNCHVLEGRGHSVGADLAAVGNKSPAALLVAILDPNRAVEDRFVNYVAVRADGRSVTGLLASESGESLIIRSADGVEHPILRSDLEALRSTGRSLMPEGLEQDLTDQDLADVIAYVGRFHPPSKQFPGHEPRIVEAGDDGLLTLPATAARIYGPSLVFEPEYQNLGFWTTADDSARWTVSVPAAGRHRVAADFACPPSTAGHELVVEVGGERLTVSVPPTADWGTYRRLELGELSLPAGEVELTVRSAGPLPDGQCLIDLKTIYLAADGVDFPAGPERPEEPAVPVIRADSQGSIRLLAGDARLAGEGLGIYEPQRCIGWWTRRDQHASWQLELAEGGRYAVEIEWAIPPEMAGNRFALVRQPSADGQQPAVLLEAAFDSTGGFEHYRVARFGEIELPAGVSELRIEPTADIQGELADLRAVVLRPESR